MKADALCVLFGIVIAQGSVAAQEPSSGKIAGTAIVVLTHEFCTAEVIPCALDLKKGICVLGNEVFRPGRLLCPSAEEAVRNSFERVIRMETAPRPEDAGGHIVLIPQFAHFGVTSTSTLLSLSVGTSVVSVHTVVTSPRGAAYPVIASFAPFERRHMSLLVEWSATEPSGKILWVQKVEGEADKRAGFNHQKIMEMVARDLAGKSTDAILKSEQIREFLESRVGK
jgi:hypothetical protein